MLPSCKQVTEMLSENLDQPISGYRRFKLKLHLMMCRYCRRYGDQLSLASRTFELLIDKQSKPSDDAREALKQQLLEEFRAITSQKSDECNCDITEKDAKPE